MGKWVDRCGLKRSRCSMERASHWPIVRLGLLAFLVFVGHVQAGSPTYTVTDLGSIGSGSLTGGVTTPYAINNLGQVVGQSKLSNDSTYHAFLYDQGTMRDLGTLGGSNSIAYDINDNGLVVGTAMIAGGSYRAFRTAPNAAIDPATDNLGLLNGTTSSTARGINQAGQVVGYSEYSSGYGLGFRTAPGSSIDPTGSSIGAFSSGWSVAYGINSSGRAVGYSGTYGSAVHPFRTAANSNVNSSTDDVFATAMDLLNSTYTTGYAINEQGTITGRMTYRIGSVDGGTNVNRGIVVGADGSWTTIPTLGGSYSDAAGINSSGDVVGGAGIAGDLSEHAFIYRNAVITDLNTLIPSGSGWTLDFAYDINDNGQIVGIGHNGGSAYRGFLLTPVPEPTTGMLGIVIGFLCLRRHRKQ